MYRRYLNLFGLSTKRMRDVRAVLDFVEDEMRTAAWETEAQIVERLLQRGTRERSMCKNLVKGEFDAVKYLTSQEVFC